MNAINIDIPGYRIVRPIGRGGMATVYLAIQENFQREVALKIMSSALTQDKTFSERFLREARIVSRLVHPNIVTVHDVGVYLNCHYMAMEYVEGLDLKERLPTLNGEQLIRVVSEVSAALHYAGRKGYVHRDVKPENIMLHDVDGRAVLMDFGIARAADSVSAMTRTGTAIGTPHYMSPEQAKGDIVDQRSDLYSLGVLFYFMLTGKVPYEAESAVAVGIKHLTASVPVLPDELSDYQPLLNKMMAKKPDERFQNGAELIDALNQLDLSALKDWRPQEDFEYLYSHEHTPVRSDVVSAAALRAAGVDYDDYDSNPTSFDNIEKAADPDQFNDAKTVVSTPQLLDEPVETLSIPKEDLAGREKPSNPYKWVPAAAIVAAMFTGGYFLLKPDGVMTTADDPLQIAELNTLESQVSVAERVQQNQPINIPSFSDRTLGENSEDKADNLASISEPSVAFNEEPVNEFDNQAQPSLTNNEKVVPQTSPVADAIDSGVSSSIVSQDSEALAEQVDSQPDLMPDLANAYRDKLNDNPNDEITLQALADLKQQALAIVSIQMDIGELDSAQDSINNALISFPEIANDEAYQRLDARLLGMQQINSLLEQGEKNLSKDRLLKPPGDNARESFQAVLAIDADNEKAISGLERIAERYLVLANAARQQNNIEKAISLAKSGLLINSKNTEFSKLVNNLESELRRQQQIAELIEEAEVYRQQGRLFEKSDSAVQRYKAVLKLDASNRRAKKGINQLITDVEQEVALLLKDNNYKAAQSLANFALSSLPDNTRLAEILVELEVNRPVIDKLLLSGEPINDLTADRLDKFNADRTLHIAFVFNGLEQPTTVMQAILYDGGRTVQIAAVPVVVIGNEGETQFRIDRPVEGFNEGGYHLDILLNGELIYTGAFGIGR